MDVVELEDGLTGEELRRVVDGAELRLSSEAFTRMRVSQDLFDRALDGDRTIYGTHTGVGDLAEVRQGGGDEEDRQRDLIRSHACGVGTPLDERTVRAAMALRAANLARGYSAVRPLVVERLCDLLNRRVVPVVPSGGSVGASGDPVLLAHVAATMIGEGEATVGGESPIPASQALEAVGLAGLLLKGREALALVNGLDFSVAASLQAVAMSRRVFRWANAIGALGLEAIEGSREPFDEPVQAVRGVGRHQDVAALICRLTRGSSLLDGAAGRGSPQDPYSYRCIPQVHGAIAIAIDHVERTLDLELVATVDNPLTLPPDGSIRHCGHFHGQSLAFACDYLAISLVGLANISHARASLLLRGHRGLPPMLCTNRDGSTGLMMLETVSASLTAKARAMATPLSIQNIAASSLQEDHVSMAWEAARRSCRLAELVDDVLAVEAVEAVEAARLRGPALLGHGSRQIFDLLEDAQAGAGTLSGRVAALSGFLQRREAPIED